MEICLSNEEPVREENNLNFIPCSIKFNGKAKVSTYFKEKDEKDGVKHSSFRGRPLLGCDIEIPEGCCGYVLKKQHEDLVSKTKTYSVEQSFKKVTNWNLDKIPSSNDAFISALDWFDIAAALHSKEEPITVQNGKKDS